MDVIWGWYHCVVYFLSCLWLNLVNALWYVFGLWHLSEFLNTSPVGGVFHCSFGSCPLFHCLMKGCVLKHIPMRKGILNYIWKESAVELFDVFWLIVLLEHPTASKFQPSSCGSEVKLWGSPPPSCSITLCNVPVPPAAKQSQSMILPPPCFTASTEFFTPPNITSHCGQIAQ